MDATVWAFIATILSVVVSIILYIARVVDDENGAKKITIVVKFTKPPKMQLIACIMLLLVSFVVFIYGVNDILSQSTSPPLFTDTLSPTTTPAGTLPPENVDKASPSPSVSTPTPTPATTSKSTPTPAPTSTATSAPTPTPTPTPTQPAPTPTEPILPFGKIVYGSITNVNDTHRYTVVLTQAGRVTLEVTRDSANGPAYLTIKWLDSNGAQIKNPTNYNMANKYNAYTDLEAGTYYIEIAKYSTHTGDYALRADFASAGNNEVEPNNNRETAQTITSGQTVRGFISEQDLTDFYKIVLTQAGRLTLEVTRDSTIGPSQLTIRWLDSDGAQIKTANPNLASKYSVYTDLEAGTYYFEIAKSGANTGVYNLQVSFASAGNNEVEPNNNRETAQTITSGQTVRGLISYQDATDFYKIVLPQAGRVTLEVTRDSTIGPSHLTIRWLDSAGAQIKTANPNLASKYGVYTDLEAGTYYFEIAKYNGNTGVYNLGVSISGT